MKRRSAHTMLGLCSVVSLSLVLPSCGRPVHSSDAEIRIPSRGIHLAARLCLPAEGNPPFPGVVIIHGSGRQTRDHVQSYCGGFNRNGVAVLIYDKRGVGASGGEYQMLGIRNAPHLLDELSDDAAAGVDYLRGRKEIDSSKIGLAGASQAGWIIPLAARKRPHVAFLILISGPTVTLGEELYYSDLTGEGRPGSPQLSEAEIAQRMQAFQGEAGFDPAPVVAELKMPSLWILGGKDESIPAARTVRILEQIRDEQKRPIAIQVHASGNHALVDVLTGAQIPYWSDVWSWLREQGVIPRRRN